MSIFTKVVLRFSSSVTASRWASTIPIVHVSRRNSDNFGLTRLQASVESAFLSAKNGGHVYVAVKCDGVAMDRHGSLELVTLNFVKPVEYAPVTYVVEVGPQDEGRDDHLACLKLLLASSSVQKVMHDCRKTSDCLHHFCDITLVNVHDTSCYEQIIDPRRDGYTGLNTLFQRYGLKRSMVREKDFYKKNPDYWTSRPLTDEMILWAAADIEQLHKIARQQKKCLTSVSERQAARRQSDGYVRDLFPYKSAVLDYHGDKWVMQRIRRKLENWNKTRIYQRSDTQFTVHYKTDKQLAEIKKVMSNPLSLSSLVPSLVATQASETTLSNAPQTPTQALEIKGNEHWAPTQAPKIPSQEPQIMAPAPAPKALHNEPQTLTQARETPISSPSMFPSEASVSSPPLPSLSTSEAKKSQSSIASTIPPSDSFANTVSETPLKQQLPVTQQEELNTRQTEQSKETEVVVPNDSVQTEQPSREAAVVSDHSIITEKQSRQKKVFLHDSDKTEQPLREAAVVLDHSIKTAKSMKKAEVVSSRPPVEAEEESKMAEEVVSYPPTESSPETKAFVDSLMGRLDQTIDSVTGHSERNQ